MNYNLHPVNFIIIAGILQIFIFSFILCFNKQGHQRTNRLLGVLLFLSALHFAWFMVLDSDIEQIIGPQVFWFPYSYLLAIGPLFYFYTRAIASANSKISQKDFYHFIPVGIEVAFQLALIIGSIRSEIQIYSTNIFLIYKVLQGIGAGISISVYVKKSLDILISYETYLSQNFSNSKNITMVWLFSLIKYIRALWIFWLLFELIFLAFWHFQLHYIPVYLLLYLFLAIITYSTWWIGLQGYTKASQLPENFIVNEFQIEVKQSTYSNLDKQEIELLVLKLHQIMENENLFRDETLSLHRLAENLGVNPNLISYILNSIIKQSFYDYVNAWRVEEVKKKMNDAKYDHIKLTEIAFDSGFNSKATFNRAFKKMTGVSPSEYKKALDS